MGCLHWWDYSYLSIINNYFKVLILNSYKSYPNHLGSILELYYYYYLAKQNLIINYYSHNYFKEILVIKTSSIGINYNFLMWNIDSIGFVDYFIINKSENSMVYYLIYFLFHTLFELLLRFFLYKLI